MTLTVTVMSPAVAVAEAPMLLNHQPAAVPPPSLVDAAVAAPPFWMRMGPPPSHVLVRPLLFPPLGLNMYNYTLHSYNNNTTTTLHCSTICYSGIAGIPESGTRLLLFPLGSLLHKDKVSQHPLQMT